MSINLALILTLLTAVSGAVVAVNKFYLRKKYPDGVSSQALRTTIEYSQSFFPVLLIVLVIRSFVFEPFRIPSGSMMPTLLQGDYIFVEKYAYGLRLPVIEKKIVKTGEPQRGDVVVFRLPTEPSVNYIKRVIGLPGDRIVYERHHLIVNGKPVTVMKDESVAAPPEQFIERLGDRHHAILISNPANSVHDGDYTVPEGQYFMMGDNRDNSRDSRFIGTVPETFLVGKAVRVWMHMDGLEWPAWRRIGMKIE